MGLMRDGDPSVVYSSHICAWAEAEFAVNYFDLVVALVLGISNASTCAYESNSDLSCRS